MKRVIKIRLRLRWISFNFKWKQKNEISNRGNQKSNVIWKNKALGRSTSRTIIKSRCY